MSSNVYTSEVTVDTASRDQLVESIRLREQRLAANVDELIGRLHPKALVHRAADAARGAVVASDGSVRVERVAALGGVILAAAGVVGFLAVRARRG